MPITIHEPIEVVALFNCGKLKPLIFVWKGKKIFIEQISFEWQTRMGAARLWHFTAAARRTLYLLVFNSVALRWTLEGIECEQNNTPH